MDTKPITPITTLVQSLLADYGIKQRALAVIVGCSPSTIGMLSTGDRGKRPSEAMMQKLRAAQTKLAQAASESILNEKIGENLDFSQGEVNKT